VDVLPSLSRLMQHGIGAQQTRADHRQISNLLYQSYAKGRELRKLEAVVGKEGLLKEDRVMLEMADSFEADFVHQGQQRRDIGQTLDLGLQLLKRYGVYPP
jgi:V/A-type H+-transporting ATPase subunit B